MNTDNYSDVKGILERMQDTYYRTDAEGKLLYISASVENTLGYRPEELKGRGAEEFYVNPDERREKIAEIKGVDHPPVIVSALKHKDGHTVWGSATSRPWYREDGSFGGIEGMIRDVTDEKKLHDALSEKEQELRTIFEMSPAGTVYFDAEGVIKECNNAALEIFAATREQLCGFNLLTQLKNDKLRKAVETVLREGKASFQGYYTSVIGSRQSYLEVNLVAIRGKQGEITSIVGLFFDRMEEKRTALALEHQSLHDALTDIPNRLLLEEHLLESIRIAKEEKSQFAVLFVDLDNFKLINDSYGHTIGDDLLVRTVKRMQKILKSRDVIARFGGDEFVIVLDFVYDLQSIVGVAQRILDVFHEPFIIKERPYFLSVSIGISIYPDDAGSTEALISSADAAMYEAKNEGKNRYHFFTTQINEGIEERIKIENGLREAIGSDQFVLYYQPQIDTSLQKVVGVEVLIRWEHPQWGFMGPDRFIALAEQNHLIIPLSQWIFKEACIQAKQWLDAGLFTGHIAVNVSGVHMQYGDLVNDITQALESSGLPAEHLMVEITESRLMHYEEKGKAIFTALQKLGVTMAIDDFGTGYSSLSYLHTFPFSMLKIDRSFICDLSESAESARLSEMIIMLAKSMHLDVLAEGVETVEQLAWLEAHGCTLIQGYLFARPMPADKMKAFFTKHDYVKRIDNE